MTVPPPQVLRRLAEALWEERLVVEQLLYRLTCSRLLLERGEHRFVTRAMDEVQVEVDRLRDVELLRSCTVQELAASVGVPEAELSLDVLVLRTDGPWPRVFGNLRAAFTELAEEIDEAVTANRELATKGLLRVREELTTMAGTRVPAGTEVG